MSPVLYLNLDGTLHPADVRVSPDEPTRPRIYLDGQPTDEPLLQFASLLELILRPYPELQVILATPWVNTLGLDFVVKRLPIELQKRVIGAVTFGASGRIQSIQADAAERELSRWVVLDGDQRNWPENFRGQLIAPNNPELGIVEPGFGAVLAATLHSLCNAAPLPTASASGAYQPAMNAAAAFPGASRAE